MLILRRLFRVHERTPARRRDDVDAEIAFHLQARIDALVARGWSLEDAAAEAVTRFGDPAVQRTVLLAEAEQRDRQLDTVDRFDSVVVEARLALRRLQRAPLFALGVVATLALGIGANATMFAVLDRLFLRPPPHVASPERVYTLIGEPRHQISFPAFMDLRERLAPSASIAVQTMAWPLPIGRGDDGQSAKAIFVDDQYFRLLGVQPVVGRFFTADDAAAPEVVIGYALWQRAFDGDPAVVGRELLVSSTHVRIAGVLPDGFNGVGDHPIDLWIPITLAAGLLPGGGAAWQWRTADNAWLTPIVRITNDTRAQAMQARVTSILQTSARERATRDTAATAELRSILPQRAGLTPEARIASLLGAVSLLVLLIACANATNLMLARVLQLEREIGIRIALGISRRRLALGLLAESSILAALGGVAAVVIAIAGTAVMRNVLLDGLTWAGRLVDRRTVAFIAIASALVALITAIAPSWFALRRIDLTSLVGRAPRGDVGGHHHMISALVVAQAGFSALLLIGTLLFVQSLTRVRDVPLGIDAAHAVAVTLDGRTLRSLGPRANELFDELRTSVARVPGVESVALVEGAPFSKWFLATGIAVPGRASTLPAIAQGAFIRAVTSPYFTTMGTRVIQGRVFGNSEDRADGELVAIVSASIARSIWPAGDAIGRCIRLGTDSMPCRRIVGVAEDTRESVARVSASDDPYAAIVYVPLSQGRHTVGARMLVARVGSSANATIASIRRAVHAAEPTIPLPEVWLMEAHHDPELRPWRIGATMFGIFGGVALLLSALGVYSVIGQSTARRARELGVRMALGARAADIVWLVGVQGATLVAIGLGIATLSAIVLAPLVQPLLFETSARSPVVYASVVAVVLVVGVTASLVPAVRATRLSPISVIRSD